ncbi:MAG: hypothetical protein JWM68_2320 [Verrucomicrobiales bacterium]|nr:hypothetical protein [Verrucomicrobiales bacterium]
MRNLKFLFTFCSLFALLQGLIHAGTYGLIDGQQISGDPISYDAKGVILKSDGTVMERTPWSKFTQDALKQLRTEAKTAKDKALIDPLIEEDIQQKAKAKEITVKEVEHLERPTGKTGFFTLFTSPLGLFILLAVYGATIYAGYEVARYKNLSVGLVAGLAAIPFLGFLSPIAFLFVQPKTHAEVLHAHRAAEEAHQHEATDYVAPSAETQAAYVEGGAEPYPAAAQEEQQPVAPVAAAVVTFRRGEFTFNRRFFETKFAGFVRPVLGEAEKNSVLYVKSLRGEFLARKISSVTQNEVVFQIFKDEATADEAIPFSEVSEVQIRPRETA